jgi:hypothetical protein
MKVINCFVLSFFLFIAGCGNFEWFPADKTAKFPVLTMAFDPTSTAISGTPLTLTFTITNALGHPAQSGLGFTDSLPAIIKNNVTYNMFVANTPIVTSSGCGSISAGTISAGDTALTFSGISIGAGPATCTASVQVTSNAATSTSAPSFVNDSSHITNVTGNLLNTVGVQSLTISPFIRSINGVTLQARDLVVSPPNGNPVISLFIDNTSTTSATVTVTITGMDSTGTLLPATAVDILPIIVSQNSTVQTPAQTVVGVASTVKAWQITNITTQ